MSETTDAPGVVYVGASGRWATTWHADPDCTVLTQGDEVNAFDSPPHSAQPCAVCTDTPTADDLKKIGENNE